MTRATKTSKKNDSKRNDSTRKDVAARSEPSDLEAPTSEVDLATMEKSNWMADLFDWQPFFGRGWRTGLPARLFDPEQLFGDRFEFGFPMRVEQFRDSGDLVIRAELPGIDPDEDVEIRIDGRRMTIEATREDKSESTDGHCSEFHYGHFHRMMTLPEGAETEAITAGYTDGILEVRVPVHVEPEATTKVPITRS